ncbi:TIGR04255 family protein [Methanobrevibacter sp.]|uniref:TIGR04255 family protein n=1 Tax=Methanobrevibacter sp. TaxID=66852 RepID=UPI003974F166
MSDRKYSKNNLNEIIFQIRFSPVLQLYTDKKDAAKDFQKIIGKEFPDDVKFQQNKKFSVTIDNDTGKPVESKTNDEFLTWIFINNSGKHIRLNGKELILSYTGELYSGFESFSNDVSLILEGLKEYPINKINSIGLRYVNQIKINEESLNEYINPNLHLINKEFDNDQVIQSISRTELKIDEYHLAFQYGQFNPEFPNLSSKKEFILDYDCILTNEEQIENILINLNEMHDIISDRFEKDIKDRLREEMGVIS